MSAILKFYFQTRKWLHFQKKIIKKDTILLVTITFSLKQGQTRTSSGPICVLLNTLTHLLTNISWVGNETKHWPTKKLSWVPYSNPGRTVIFFSTDRRLCCVRSFKLFHFINCFVCDLWGYAVQLILLSKQSKHAKDMNPKYKMRISNVNLH